MRFGYHTITWGGVVGDPTGVTSVKDLFYRVNGSMERAVLEIASLGYEGVEMFDGNVHDFADRPEELSALLATAGVEDGWWESRPRLAAEYASFSAPDSFS